jgi:hypothetical protein
LSFLCYRNAHRPLVFASSYQAVTGVRPWRPRQPPAAVVRLAGAAVHRTVTIPRCGQAWRCREPPPRRRSCLQRPLPVAGRLTHGMLCYVMEARMEKRK